NLDWKEQLRNMVLRTHLLSHRDDYDLLYNGWTIDIKTEDYGPNHDSLVEKIVKRSIRANEVYGERLVNAQQFDENYRKEAEIFLYSCLDKRDPRKARKWHAIGWILANQIPKL